MSDPRLIEVAFILPVVQPAGLSNKRKAWENSDLLEEEELIRAIAIALFDHAQRLGLKALWCYSAAALTRAVACPVRLMVRLPFSVM